MGVVRDGGGVKSHVLTLTLSHLICINQTTHTMFGNWQNSFGSKVTSQGGLPPSGWLHKEPPPRLRL